MWSITVRIQHTKAVMRSTNFFIGMDISSVRNHVASQASLHGKAPEIVKPSIFPNSVWDALNGDN